MTIPGPYLVFLGAVTDTGYAKTALGLAQWRPENCKGQLRFANCGIDLKLPDMTVTEAVAQGVKTLVIGVAPVGGAIEQSWINTLLTAIEAGLSIAAGLHSKLNEHPQLATAAKQHNVKLIDVRTPPANLPIATGKKRSGKRLLTIGTDCASGKKYTALAISKTLHHRGVNATFRATGQTGIMIAGGGIPIDSVVSDFVAGAAEILSPDNKAEHWDIIEGQGSLFHPAYAGVSLGLLHGSQPDALVLCHNPGRKHLLGWPDYPMPDIETCIRQAEIMGAVTNPAVKCIGICVNSSEIKPNLREKVMKEIEQKTGLPCVDPLVGGVERIVEQLSNTFEAAGVAN